MTSCTIRFRLDASGPAVYVVETPNGLFLYSRGEFSQMLSPERVRGMLASRSQRWVPAAGTLETLAPEPSMKVHRHATSTAATFPQAMMNNPSMTSELGASHQ